MNRALGIPATVALLCVAACLPKPASQQNSPDRAEVVVIGTIHHFQLLHPDNTPAHLRALLYRVRPDVIAVENPPDWQRTGRHLWTQLPEYYVAEEYGRDNHIPVVGIADVPQIDCPATPPPETLDRAIRFAKSAGGLRSLGAWEALMAFGEESWGFAAAQDRVELERMEPFSRAALTDSASIRFQDSLSAGITALARQHRGRRIAVLVGSSALYPQRVRLRKNPGIALLDARTFLPARSEVEAARRIPDAVLLLGASLDGWSVPNMPHARNLDRAYALLLWLQARDSEGSFATYYMAKWQMLFGRYDEAARLLDSLVARRRELPWLPNSEWSWPPWSPIDLKAQFARATLHDLTGDRAAAQRVYQELLARVPSEQLRPRVRGPNSYYDLKGYLKDLAREPYRGGSWEAFRIQEFRRCWPTDQVPGDVWPR